MTIFPTVPDVIDRAVLANSHPLDWFPFATKETIPDMLSTPFNVIFGADIVYEGSACCLDARSFHLSCPDGSNKDPVFHLVMYTLKSSTVEEVFGSGYRVFSGPQRVLTMLERNYCL